MGMRGVSGVWEKKNSGAGGFNPKKSAPTHYFK
jgi:hypothetical protein